MRAERGDVTTKTELPTFDGPEFAKWLRRWMEAHDLSVPGLAAASGLHKDTISILRRGEPHSSARKSQRTHQINVNTLAQVAHGLGLPLGYVAARAGLGDEGGRWDEFSLRERQAIAKRLGGDPDDLDRTLREITQAQAEGS